MAYEGATFALQSVWGPIVGFVIGAPLLFTLPLFMFTKHLYRVKKRALDRFHEKALGHAMAFEHQWLYSGAGTKGEILGREDLAALNNLSAVYGHIERVRVVPFDLRSFLELMLQTLGSLLPLLPYLGVSEPALKILEGLFRAVR